MKKLFVLLLCFIFPLMVNAEEDKVTVENFDTYIMVLDMDHYSHDETADVKVIFGDTPDTYYYYKNIPKVGNYKYTGKSKSISYDADLTYTDVPDTYYDIDFDNNKNYIISVGTDTDLLNENNTIKLSYSEKFTGNKLIKNKEYHFDIAGSDYYDTKKTSFKIILSDMALRGTIYFSNNGKDYFKTLDGLNYKIGDYSDLTGTYNKTIAKGNKLSIRIVLDTKDRGIKLGFKEIVVYSSLGVFVLFVLVIIYKIFNRKKRK